MVSLEVSSNSTHEVTWCNLHLSWAAPLLVPPRAKTYHFSLLDTLILHTNVFLPQTSPACSTQRGFNICNSLTYVQFPS